jgi:hypothetical protein
MLGVGSLGRARRRGGGGGGGASATGSVTTPSGVYAGNAPFVSGSLSGASAAKARLYDVTGAAYSGAAVDVYVNSGTWVCGAIPATAASAGTYRIDLLASDGVTVIQAGSNFTTTLWSKPADSWRATIATGQASATNGSGIFDSSATSGDMTALQASSTGKTLPAISVSAGSLGAALVSPVVSADGVNQYVTVTLAAHGLVAGDWVKGSGNSILSVSGTNVPITFVSSSVFRIPTASVPASSASIASCTIQKITPTTRTIGFALTSPQSPGAIVYGSWKTNVGSNITGSVSTVDFNDASPAAITIIQPRPTTYIAPDNYYDRGWLAQVPANNGGTSFVKIALNNYDTVTSYCYLGVFQLRADSNHSLWNLHGPSITHYALQVLELRAWHIAKYPSSDPIFVNWGHPGAKYGLINSGAVTPSLANGVPWGFALYDADPNDIGDQTSSTQRPYATNNGAANTIATDLDAGVSLLKAGMPGRPIYVANGDYFNAPDKVPIVTVKSGGNTGNGTITNPTVLAKNGAWQLRMTSATTFTITDPDGILVPYLSNTSLPTGTTIDSRYIFNVKVTVGGTPFVAGDGWDFTSSKAVDGLRGEAMGMKPFNDNLILAKLRAMTGAYAIRAPLDAPLVDSYTGKAALWDIQLNTEGTHDGSTGYIDLYEMTLGPAIRHSQTGEPGNSRLEDFYDAIVGYPITPTWQTRLNAVIASLPSTADAVATARRAQISATVTASAATAYSEPSVPSNLPLAWMDPARTDLVTLSTGLQVGSVTDRIGGWSWTASQYNTASAPNPPPGYLPTRVKGRNMLRFGSRSSTMNGQTSSAGLECTAAGFLATVATGAGAALTYMWVERSHPAAQFGSVAGISWQISNAGTSLAYFGMSASAPINTLTKAVKFVSTALTEAAVEPALTVTVYTLVYIGTGANQWQLYKTRISSGSLSTVSVTSTISKATWAAATIVRLGMNSTINGGANQADQGDWMAWNTALNSTDRAAWEAYLAAKWI